MLRQPAPRTALQQQGGHHQGERFPQTDRTERCGVSKQFGTGLLHPRTAKGTDPQGDIPLRRLLQQGFDQQAALEIA